MALRIEIANKCRARVDSTLIKRAARAVLGGGEIELSVALFGPAAMRALNKRVLGHDYATDVISFDHGQGPHGARLLELALCPAVAREGAKTHRVPFEQEFARYVVHGCLHLVGHDDRTRREREAMWAVQERILAGLFGGTQSQLPA